jgi:hypothetical protein
MIEARRTRALITQSGAFRPSPKHFQNTFRIKPHDKPPNHHGLNVWAYRGYIQQIHPNIRSEIPDAP